MGHCYEFGVTIKDGCGHAMRVPTKTGACVCPTCNARCEGRFEACARIVSKKGYVPATAPKWAIDCTEPPKIKAPPPRRTMVAAPVVAADSTPSSDDAGLLRPELDTAKAVADAVEQAQTRLIDALRAELLQSLQPSIAALREELLTSVDEVRRELADRDKELVSAYDRLSASFSQLAEGAGVDRGTDKAVVEGLARVARRVGRIERSLGQRPPA